MRTCFLMSILLTIPQHGWAWGQEGHAIIGEIAQRYLSPKTQARIADLIGQGVSLASVSTWADDVRAGRPETSNWHFVAIPSDSLRYDAARDCKPNPEMGDCIIAALARLRAELTSPRTAPLAKREALKFLIHFVGDIHQPLHALLEDRGGNDRRVSFFVGPSSPSRPAIKEDTNLHAVWDSGLIRHCVRGWNAYVSHLQSDWLPKQDVTALAEGSVIDWAQEAHQAATDVVWTVPMDADLGEEYVTRAVPELDRQLAVAGLRLARVLNETFGSASRPYAAQLPQETPAGWSCK